MRKGGTRCYIARRGLAPRKLFDHLRQTVERRFVWLNRFLRIRYERRTGVHSAFTDLAGALIAFRTNEQLC
jgi:hypothetical protein